MTKPRIRKTNRIRINEHLQTRIGQEWQGRFLSLFFVYGMYRLIYIKYSKNSMVQAREIVYAEICLYDTYILAGGFFALWNMAV